MAELNPEESTPEAPIELTQRQLARVLGCAPSSIVAWERDGGLPSLGDRGRERWYDAAVAVRWYVDRELARRGADDPDRRRLLAATADKAELGVMQRLGRLIDLEEARRGCAAIGRVTAEKLLGFPPRIAPVLVGLDAQRIQSVLDDEMKMLIGQLADLLDAVAKQ